MRSAGHFRKSTFLQKRTELVLFFSPSPSTATTTHRRQNKTPPTATPQTRGFPLPPHSPSFHNEKEEEEATTMKIEHIALLPRSPLFSLPLSTATLLPPASRRRSIPFPPFISSPIVALAFHNQPVGFNGGCCFTSPVAAVGVEGGGGQRRQIAAALGLFWRSLRVSGFSPKLRD